MNAETQPLSAVQIESAEPVACAAGSVTRCEIKVRVEHNIEAVEDIWRTLTERSIESPGQSYDFIKLWVENRRLTPDAQRYVVAEVDGRPIALLPLHRKRVRGVSVFTWFPGANVGCYAPIADYDRLAGLGILGRAALWRAMTSALEGADLVYLRSMPRDVGGHIGIFDELGTSLQVETLYRAEFASWDECDSLQRTKTRRKHDRQQGDRLLSLGKVTFEVAQSAEQRREAVDIMFRQRSARFHAQGIRDVFVYDKLIGFYQQAAQPGSGVDVRLHVLRLNGEIVAVRYNVVYGDRMFCLISSMSDDPRIQVGSPGKQCLLRVMQTVFDDGIRVFDMGSGFTDEKRHWCNVQAPLRQHYIGLNGRGEVVAWVHRAMQLARAWAKSNPAIKTTLRAIRQFGDRLSGRRTSASASE